MTLVGVVHHFEVRAQDRIFQQVLDSRGRQCSRALEDLLGPTTRLTRKAETWQSSFLSIQESPLGDEPWYRDLMESEDLEEVVWNEFPGLVASYGWRNPQDQSLRIAALAFTDDTTAQIHRDLSVSPRSLVAILKDDGLVSWLSGSEEAKFHSATLGQLMNSSEAHQRWIAQIFLSWNEAGRPLDLALPVHQKKEEWRAQVFPLQGEERRMMALAIPRADLKEQLASLTRPYLYALLTSILLPCPEYREVRYC